MNVVVWECCALNN